MINLQLKINSAEEAQRFITECENEFYSGLENAITKIIEGGKNKVITLSGPTCSGKTTTASRLISRISKLGYHSVVLSIDDFFRDRMPKKHTDTEAPDYDTVKALDMECLSAFISRLLNGKSVLVPKYDFTKTARVGYNEYIPDERDIYVFEGIQAVYPEVTSLLGDKYKSIYISVEEDISYNGAVLTKNEVRLLRRVVRDDSFRGATAEFTLHLWEGVRRNEEENIFPNAVGCDLKVSSFLRYEPFIIRNHVSKLLDGVPKDSRYKYIADELLEKISEFKCEYFDDCMIPRDSVFREFIG